MTIITRCIATIAILLIVGVCAPRRVAAQPMLDDNASGTTYILAFPDTTANRLDSRFPNNKFVDGFSILLYSAVGPNKVRIITGGGTLNVVTLSAGKFLSYAVKYNPIITVSNTVQYSAIHLEAEKPIVVYCFFATKQSCEAWTPIPVEMWGLEYNVAATPGSFVNDIGLAGETAVPLYPKPAPAEFMIIAAYDNTTVDIEDFGRTLVGRDGHPLPGTQRRITLGENQCYQFQSYIDSSKTADSTGSRWPSSDIAGIRIKGDKPIGVISGNTRTARAASESPLGNNVYKNMLMEWLPPSEQLGTEFVYLPTWDSHRPEIGAPAEREGEYVRLYSGDASPLKGYYRQQGFGHVIFISAVTKMNMAELRDVLYDEVRKRHAKIYKHTEP
ncbi:MAG: hypothetical protein ABI876_16440, partial [Bacteroidota bacterium]